MVWIILIVIAVLLILFIVGAFVKSNEIRSFETQLNENINKEIELFFNAKQINYQFNNVEIEEELKFRLRASMIDQRSKGYTYNNSYINRTTTKDKEIYSIINKYYELDKKGRVYDISFDKK